MRAVTVHGNPTAEEVAALLALLSARQADEEPDGYRQWRATRLKALRRKASENLRANLRGD
jgi:hypothetical protein